jgi:hypothetical protein
MTGSAAYRWLIVASLAVGAPPASEGAWLGFRNDLQVPVAMRAAMVVNGVFTRSRPIILYPGEKTTECLIQTGERQIAVLEAKFPNRVLYQGTIPCSQDAFYSIQLVPPNQVKLVKTTFPDKPPKRSSR